MLYIHTHAEKHTCQELYAHTLVCAYNSLYSVQFSLILDLHLIVISADGDIFLSTVLTLSGIDNIRLGSG